MYRSKDMPPRWTLWFVLACVLIVIWGFVYDGLQRAAIARSTPAVLQTIPPIFDTEAGRIRTLGGAR